jgi:glycerophosphoryl diester phosphodiesterase
MISFRRAFEDGADGIEFDVRLAGDGVPVVIHDPTLRRTARRAGIVAKLSSLELHETDVGTWFNLRHPSLASPEYATATIPTLAMVFESFTQNDRRLYVEMKCGPRDREALATEVTKLIRKFPVIGRVVVESFDLAAIAIMKRLDPHIRTAALFDRRLSRPAPAAGWMIKRALAAGAAEIALHRSLASLRTVRAAARQNLETVIWTADAPAWVERAIKRGIGAIITNHPGRLHVRRAELIGES